MRIRIFKDTISGFGRFYYIQQSFCCSLIDGEKSGELRGA